MRNTGVFNDLREGAPLVSVGVLTADLLSLGSQLKLIESAGAKLVHVDVMDGRFCPTITVGPPLIKAIKTAMLKDVHLMIEEPLAAVESFVAAGADIITVHAESSRHIHRVLQALGEMTNVNDAGRGILRGVGLNPGTPIDVVGPLMDEIEMVLLLAINPGWKGQKFIPATGRRVAEVIEVAGKAKKDILVCVDGGVTRDNIGDVARMGADIIVAGSAIFDGKAPSENAKFMIGAAREAAPAR